MRRFLRTAYRLLILNKIIRWTWVLALLLYGVKVGTDRGFAWYRTPASKTIFKQSPELIESFRIQNELSENITFSRQDSVWLVVKNNITLRLPEDSVKPYLLLFSKIERLSVKSIQTDEGIERVGEKPKFRVVIFGEKGISHSLLVYYEDMDSLINERLTFIKLADERLLNGVRGDWMQILGRNFDDFRDRRYFDFPLTDANQISFQSPVDTLNFFCKDSVWSNRSNVAIEPFVFKNFVENLAILRGPFFYDADRDLLAERKVSNRLIVKTPTDTAILTAFKLDNFYVVHSSRNPTNFFRIDSTSTIFFK
jgi:hypothetical protein